MPTPPPPHPQLGTTWDGIGLPLPLSGGGVCLPNVDLLSCGNTWWSTCAVVQFEYPPQSNVALCSPWADSLLLHCFAGSGEHHAPRYTVDDDSESEKGVPDGDEESSYVPLSDEPLDNSAVASDTEVCPWAFVSTSTPEPTRAQCTFKWDWGMPAGPPKGEGVGVQESKHPH